ncbi:MAG: AMP-binding protein, partial [Saprospiraceae bacterium]
MKVWQQDWIARWALYSPNKPAIQEHDTDRICTYGELNGLADELASFLKERFHISKGDRIAILAEFSITNVALFSAAQKLGFIIVPVNYRLTQPEVTDIFLDATPTMIITESKFRHLVHTGFDAIHHPIEILENQSPVAEFQINPVAEDDPIFIIYTSGTTGKPKGVKYTHKMAFWNSINTSISLKLTSESRTINVMPPFHTGGWNVLLLPFLHHGGFTYLCRKFESSIVLDKLSSLQCNIFMGVPTMLAMMAQEPDFDAVELSALNYIIVGGESMPIPLIDTYAKKHVAIRQGYGMTEVGPNLTSLHQDDA